MLHFRWRAVIGPHAFRVVFCAFLSLSGSGRCAYVQCLLWGAPLGAVSLAGCSPKYSAPCGVLPYVQSPVWGAPLGAVSLAGCSPACSVSCGVLPCVQCLLWGAPLRTVSLVGCSPTYSVSCGVLPCVPNLLWGRQHCGATPLPPHCASDKTEKTAGGATAPGGRPLRTVSLAGCSATYRVSCGVLPYIQ